MYYQPIIYITSICYQYLHQLHRMVIIAMLNMLINKFVTTSFTNNCAFLKMLEFCKKTAFFENFEEILENFRKSEKRVFS